MFIGIPIIFLTSFAVYVKFRLSGWSLRDSVVGCWLALALFVFLSTETLSLFHWFKPLPIVCAWGALLAALAALLFLRRRETVTLCGKDFSALCGGCKYFSTNYRFSFIAVAVILTLTFVHALVAPSFNVDSLSYHLPRATHWLVNGSIRFYETAIARQNFQAPLYSMCLAHLMALTKCDLFLNLIQWCAFIVNAVVLSLIAKELKAGRRGQWLIAVMSFCVPQALSQTIVCVNDLFASTAVMAFVLYLIRFLTKRDVDLRLAVYLAVAMGIAFIAKYTSLIHIAGFAIPLSVAGLIKIWRKTTFKYMARFATLLAVVAVTGSLFLMPQVTRNMRYYGAPLSGEPPSLMTNINLTPKKFAVNYVKNVSMHMAFPLYALNRPVERVVRKFAGNLINDSDISYQNKLCFTDYRIFTPLGKFSSNASNPVQLALYLLLMIMLTLSRFKKSAGVLEYSFVPVLFGSILYCMILKFQPWCARLQLPYFMMMILGIVLWLEQQKHEAVLGGFVTFCSLSYAILHVALFNDWYMPAFLYGDLPESSGCGAGATLVDKIHYLQKEGWPKETIAYMKRSVPPVLEKGYSIFFTARNRLYIGNQYHNYQFGLYDDCLDCTGVIQKSAGVNNMSSNVGLIISSDHGRIFPEKASFKHLPFSWEFLLWKMTDNVVGEKPLRFEHFAEGNPVDLAKEYFSSGKGFILSDYSRESVLVKLRESAEVDRVFSNRTFSVYSVDLK